MSTFALLLILVSAVAHATWNYLAKRTHGGAVVVWMYDLLSVVLYAPLAVFIFIGMRQPISEIGWILIVGSAFIHLAYFLLLQTGYRVGDLSLVYPLARGTGPLLSTICAIAIFGERPALIGLAGIALVMGGIFVITGGPSLFRAKGKRVAVIYGLLIGVLIAFYTLWDKQGVSTFLVPPILYNYSAIAIRMVLLAPYALSRQKMIREELRTHRWEIAGIALLSPLSYFLILTALVFTPLSYVAPTREIGILFGAFLGTSVLAEGDTKRRLLAAGMIVIGIAALAITS